MREMQIKRNDIYKGNGGALDGGSPMSHVEFKKWLCQLSLFFLISMSILKWSLVVCRI